MTRTKKRGNSPGRAGAARRPPSPHTTSDDRQPPPAPELHPRVRMHRSEAVGMAVIGLVPLLALLGVLGPKVERTEGQAGPLGLEVRYPARYRLGMTKALEARVSNRSRVPLPRVTLAVDDAYLEGFATVSPTPEFTHAYAVELTDLAPGETRTVVVDLEADHAGRFQGRATATHARDSVTVPLTTLIFP